MALSQRTDAAALVQAAKDVRTHAHAPYSRYQVGAAVRLRDGRVALGVNVENPSYGLTVCAERNAVAAAVALGAQPQDVVAVAVVAHGALDTVSPCGACRQVLAHFAAADAQLVVHALPSGQERSWSVAALLPAAFSLAAGPELPRA